MDKEQVVQMDMDTRQKIPFNFIFFALVSIDLEKYYFLSIFYNGKETSERT